MAISDYTSAGFIIITTFLFIIITLQLLLCIILARAFMLLWKLVSKKLSLPEFLPGMPVSSALDEPLLPLAAPVAIPEEVNEPLLMRSANVERDIVNENPSLQFHRFRTYTAEEIRWYTDNFAEEREVGRGGSGTVYRGRMECGTEIAVKKLDSSQQWSKSVLLAEVAAISRTSHRHVVALLGCCWESLCLVYEYVPNKTLSAHLRRTGNQREHKSLSWKLRKKIVVQCAHALTYLHHFCNPSIVHRDVKTGNILLDANYDAKLADFGLARLMEKTHVITAPGGTLGYISPQHIFNIEATTKSDVYSFGVVILEIITGMPALLPKNNRICHLVSLVLNNLEKKHTLDFVDSSPEDPMDVKEVSNMIMVALGCLNKEAEKRPSMIQVLQFLEYGIQFPPYVLQAYSHQVISELSNPTSTLCKSVKVQVPTNFDISFSNDYGRDDRQPSFPFDSRFQEDVPSLSLSRKQLSQKEHGAPSHESKSNASSFVDAYSLLSSITFSGIGSNTDHTELQLASGDLFNHALYLENNDPIFGVDKSTNYPAQNDPLFTAIDKCSLVPKSLYNNMFIAKNSSIRIIGSAKQNQEPLCTVASIQDWNQQAFH